MVGFHNGILLTSDRERLILVDGQVMDPAVFGVSFDDGVVSATDRTGSIQWKGNAVLKQMGMSDDIDDFDAAG